jgi:hypothetical protein
MQVTPTQLTQAEAARAARVSRTTIWRAVKRGRLSVTQGDDGDARIDASELLRVFPRADLQRARETFQNDAVDTRERRGDSLHTTEFTALQAHLAELQADKQRMAAELARAAEERTQLLSMLARRDEILEERDRVLAQQLEQVRLLTDARTSRRPWWKRWW